MTATTVDGAIRDSNLYWLIRLWHFTASAGLVLPIAFATNDERPTKKGAHICAALRRKQIRVLSHVRSCPGEPRFVNLTNNYVFQEMPMRVGTMGFLFGAPPRPHRQEMNDPIKHDGGAAAKNYNTHTSNRAVR